MAEPELRLPCPVCLGATMDKVALGPGGALTVDYCRRCGGAWLEHGEVQGLRRLAAGELWKRVEKRHYRFLMRCHDCHGPLERAEERCPACGWVVALDCPGCARPLQAESHAGLRLDVCRDCKGVWFDHHELEAIWGAGLDQALRNRRISRGATLGPVGSGPGEVLVETLFYAPELAFHGARAAGHVLAASAEALAHVPAAVAATPEAAATAFELVGDAAGAVFEVVVSIVGGIFDGL